MKLLPITETQSSFLDVEIVGRHIDDEDPEVAAVVEIVAEHLARSGGKSFAVPNAAVLRRLILDVVNAIDDAIVGDRSEKEGFGAPKDARGLQRTGDSLSKKLRGL
jgi:hypothetical protein